MHIHGFPHHLFSSLSFFLSLLAHSGTFRKHALSSLLEEKPQWIYREHTSENFLFLFPAHCFADLQLFRSPTARAYKPRAYIHKSPYCAIREITGSFCSSECPGPRCNQRKVIGNSPPMLKFIIINCAVPTRNHRFYSKIYTVLTSWQWYYEGTLLIEDIALYGAATTFINEIATIQTRNKICVKTISNTKPSVRNFGMKFRVS